jgi:hypothetical protein
VPPGHKAIHVADREADDFASFAWFCEGQRHMVIRIKHDRLIDVPGGAPEHEHLFSFMDQAQGRLVREVPLSRRKEGKIHSQKAKRNHPVRKARLATLHFSATTVLLPRPKSLKEKVPDGLAWTRTADGEQVPRPGVLARLPDSITVNVVRVWEPQPPLGEEPVEWRLITTEPIDTADRIAHVVDIYRSRWLIEEFFKALKTGCAIEERQLEDGGNLMNALATFVPIAYRLLLMRHLSRHAPHTPASAVLNDVQLDILRAVGRSPLPADPTVEDALVAVARLAGHLKRNGPPGWHLLAKGYAELLTLERGWRARDDSRGCAVS